MRRALLALTALALTAQPALSQVTSPATRSGRSTVYAPRSAVGTSQPLATGAALKILEEGGNAFDAAVAAAAVLNVTEPYMTGIGGDMFALVWSAEEGRLVGLDGSGRAGSKASAQTLRAAGETRVPYQGPRSVTVPGA
ncbi:MAG TPA: gamma-glutamyltransferase, partial [Longimicrobiales bacterium]|nr:gamma-glutamyltransferase [Longimicrobiales bacterium]